VLVRDATGRKIFAGEHPVGEPTADGLDFSANVVLDPGSYIVRVAVIDGAGRVGSVDHRVEVKPVPVGALTASGPLLIRIPPGAGSKPRLALNTVRKDERLALQLDLEGDGTPLAGAGVLFEIAATPDGPSLVAAPAELTAGPRGGWMLAQAVADLRLLPPGSYVARARVTTGTERLGEVLRPFTVADAPAATVSTAGSTAATPPDGATPGNRVVRAVVPVPPFAVEQALSPQVLGGFLERVAARSDAASPMIRDLVSQARKDGVGRITVSDTLAAEYPVAAFLRGLTLLSQNRLEHAANAFRAAMRGSADFYPAMVYLGVCYAAGGNDKEASGAWRTALIKEGDVLPLHILLADSLLRQGKGDLALEAVDGARARWGEDDGLKRRFVLAALLSGEYADGLQTLDDLLERRADDEASLSAGLLVLYESVMNGKPVDSLDNDRTRMVRLADAYKARGYPSVALVDTWVAEVTRRQ
jgi:tetratricopeptide (TPR) repeat protein